MAKSEPKLLFTADQHWGSESIIRLCKRPFSSVDQQDEEMIYRWNSVVEKHDTVYHIGDMFGDIDIKRALAIRSQLNGGINLLLGNHDEKKSGGIAEQIPQAFGWMKDRYCLNLKKPQKLFIVLDHYSGRVWKRSFHGSWQLYGHSHGNLPDDPMLLQFDVGVDCWDFTPITLQQVIDRMTEKIRHRATLSPWPCDLHHAHKSHDEAVTCIEKRL